MVTQLRIKAKADSHKINDLHLIKEGQEYNGILSGKLVMIDCEGLIIIQDIDKQLKDTFDIVSEVEVPDVESSNIASINQHMKRVGITDWVHSNTSPEQLLMLTVLKDTVLPNNTGFDHSGSEFFNHGEMFVAVKREDNMVMLQKRKGSIFYSHADQLSSYFKVQTFDDKDYTYANLKEVQYIINSDYKPRLVKY